MDVPLEVNKNNTNYNRGIIMSEQKTSNVSGLGTILFIVFLILKLTNVIDWSWWWVTAPLWIPICMILFGLLLIGASYYYGKK